MATSVSSSNQSRSSLFDALNSAAKESGAYYTPPPVPANPAGDINQAIQNSVYNVVPPVEDGLPRPGGLNAALDTGLVQNQQDVSRAMGTPFIPSAEQMFDKEGNPLLNEQGEKVYRPLRASDWQSEQQMQLANAVQIRDDMQGGDIQTTVENILKSNNERLGLTGTARLEAKLGTSDKESKQYADQTQADVKAMSYRALDAAFNPDKTKTTVNYKGDNMPVGYMVAINEAGEDGAADYIRTNSANIGMLLGLAQAQAYNQTARDGKASQAYSPTTLDGSSIEDMKAMSTMIDSVSHHLGDFAEKAGIPLSRASADLLAQGSIDSERRAGRLIPYMDPETSKIHFFKSPKAADESRSMQKFADVVSQRNSYKLPSQTPNPAGTNFIAGKPQLTVESPKSLKISTKAADATKTILGSINLQFLDHNIKAKTAWLADITSEANAEIDQETGQFLFSRSIHAKRHKLSEEDYKAAYDKVDPDLDFDKNDPKQQQKYEQQRKEKASEIMDMALKALEFDLANANKLMGRSNYSEWKHSLANQRFFPASAGVDYMGSKRGTRDMITFADKDLTNANFLFDKKETDNEVERLKAKAIKIFQLDGVAQQKALLALPQSELGAIGTMLNATINYYTAVAGPEGLNPSIVKQAPADIIKLYTPTIGMALANLGRQYNEWLADPKIEGHEDINEYMASMEDGEATGSINLWDDMFRLEQNMVNPQLAKGNVFLTHNSFDDGNQNGIFLQALFFGSFKNADRLGTFNPKLADMREYAFTEMTKIMMDELQTDSPELATAFQSVLDKMEADMGLNKLAKEFMKAPLMQTSYGKDASMFREQVAEFINSVMPSESRRLLMRVTGSDNSNLITDIVSKSLETTLRKVVQSHYTQVLKGFGRVTSMMNTSVIIPGPTGDHWILTPTGITPVVGTGDSVVWNHKLANGKSVPIKTPNYVTRTFQSDGEDMNIMEMNRGLSPTASKERQYFFNRSKQAYDIFDNALGTSQQRYMVVMPIQSLDGDLVKMTTLNVNKGRTNKAPVPVLWVHDSIISSAGGSLIYRNAYNNISIPSSIDYISKFPKLLDEYLDKSYKKVMEKVSKQDYVGIGEMGEYPALGAYFDELYDRTIPGGGYETYYTTSYGASKWKKKLADMIDVLEEARKFGWMPQDAFNDRNMFKQLAVKSSDFKRLIDLARNEYNLGDNKNQLKDWAIKAPREVKETFEQLVRSAGVNGIGQMTYGGGSPRKTGLIANYKESMNKYKASKESETPVVSDEEELTPFQQQVVSARKQPIPKKRSYEEQQAANELGRQEGLVESMRGSPSQLEAVVSGRDSRVTNPKAIAYAQELLQRVQDGLDKDLSKQAPIRPTFKGPMAR